MRRTGWALLAIVLGIVGLGNGAFAGPRYALDASYDPDRAEIHGTLTVTFAAPLETAYFLLLPNLDREPNPYLPPRSMDLLYPEGFSASSLDVEAVAWVDGEARAPATYRLLAMPPALQTYSLDETVLAVDASSAPATLEIRFTTSAPRLAAGDGGLTGGTFTWRFGWFPVPMEDRADRVERDGTLFYEGTSAFPLVLPPMTIEADLTLPRDVILCSGADRTERFDVDGDRWLTRYHLQYEAPTRSVAIAFGSEYATYTLDGPTPIHVTYFEGHVYEARLLATFARDILAEYALRYGDYPRAALTIVENPNKQGDSFSADGIVWLSSRFFTHRDVLLPDVLQRLTEFVLAHEIAHQWFGIGMGVDLDAEAWLSEGLAQYAAVGYFERAYGTSEPNLFAISDQGLLQELVSRQFGYLNLREHLIELPYLVSVWSAFDEALVKPTSDVEFGNETSTRLYDKGYLVARALAAAVGEPAFDRALRRAVEQGRGATVDSAGLRAVVEAEAGRSLEAWFDVWVYGAGSVDYAVRIVGRTANGNDYETTVVVTRDGGAPQAVDVEAVTTSGETARQTWDGEGDEAQLVFRTSSFVTRVTVDPEHRLPDRQRLNDNDPIRIVGAVSRASLPLDAFVVAPDASGGLVISYLDRFRAVIGQNAASFAVRRGRDHQVFGGFAATGSGAAASLGWALTRYEEVETGSAGRSVEPSMTLSAAAYRIPSLQGAFYLARATATRLASTAHRSTESVAVDWISNGSGRLALAAFDEVRVFPGIYLQGTGLCGFALGDVPQTLLYTFGELHADVPAPSRNKLSARLTFEFPSSEGLPYSLLNLAMIESQRLRVFVAGGAGWTNLDGFGTTSPSAEAGIEQVLDLSTLGGLVSFSIEVGIAVPITGALMPVLYVDVSL